MKKAAQNASGTAEARARLDALEAARDQEVCRKALPRDETTRLFAQGAHDPTPSRYFVLEELFAKLKLDEKSHLLDVGCGHGRVLAFFVDAGLPGRVSGVELDPEIAAECAHWARQFDNVNVTCGDATAIPLGDYTHFYLYNPFDSPVLARFVARIEADATGPVTMCHMSDNGEYYLFWGRPGWTLLEEGQFTTWEGQRIFDAPQHYSIWRFRPPRA